MTLLIVVLLFVVIEKMGTPVAWWAWLLALVLWIGHIVWHSNVGELFP